MSDEDQDMPLNNFGADTEVAAPPAAEPEAPADGEQTAQPTDTNGSEEAPAEQPADNPIVEDQESGRPEKRDRLQNRFGEMTARIKSEQERNAELEAQLARYQAMQSVPQLQADENGEYSIQAIQQQQAQMAQAAAKSEVGLLRQQMEGERIASRMDSEGAQIEQTLVEKGLTNPIHTANIQAEVEERIALASGNLRALSQISPMKIAERYLKAIEAERRSATTQSAQDTQSLQAAQAVSPSSAPAPADPNSFDALERRVADIKF